MIVVFYGCSDDLVEIEGEAPMLNGMDKGRTSAEWPASEADKEPVPFHIVGPSGKCESCGHPKDPKHIATVYAIYDIKGTWTFAITMADEDENGNFKWPDGWTVTVKQRGDSVYSMELVLNTGDDEIGILKPGEGNSDD